MLPPHFHWFPITQRIDYTFSSLSFSVAYSIGLHYLKTGAWEEEKEEENDEEEERGGCCRGKPSHSTAPHFLSAHNPSDTVQHTQTTCPLQRHAMSTSRDNRISLWHRQSRGCPGTCPSMPRLVRYLRTAVELWDMRPDRPNQLRLRRRALSVTGLRTGQRGKNWQWR